MKSILEKNEKSVILGQGVSDHKGIFGSTTGLTDQFGSNRVIDVPLPEEAITGIGLGLSLNGYYPIMTHIRADFSFLAMNQIINLFAKYKYMYGGQFSVPGLIRLVVGRSWGQGAQHSQSPQSLFSHIPGLTVIMPSNSLDVIQQYKYASENYDSLVISIEHRLLYDLEFVCNEDVYDLDSLQSPWGTKIKRVGTDITIIATSIMVLEALRASEFLSENYEIECEVLDLGSPSHPDRQVILESLGKTRKLIVADTSWSAYGVAAEIARIVVESNPNILNSPMRSVTTVATPCPTGKSLEDIFYPSLRDLTSAVLQVIDKKFDNVKLSNDLSFRDYYIKFKGPF